MIVRFYCFPQSIEKRAILTIICSVDEVDISIITNFVAIPAIVIYVLALPDKRKRNLGGIMTWGQGFISGLIITLVVVILNPLAQYLTYTIISPEYFANVIEYSVSNDMVTLKRLRPTSR